MLTRALVTDGQGGMSLVEVELDAPGAGEVLVRLTAAGVCHTDIDSLHWGTPLVLGHEGAGIVTGVGPAVDTVRPGDTVLLNWAMPCGRCAQCARGNASLCGPAISASTAPEPWTLRSHCHGAPIGRSFGLGTFATATVVPASAVTRIPASVPPTSACIVGCSVLTGVGSVLNVARVQPGDSVVVLGCGAVGLNVIQGARIAGAGRIVAIDARPERLSLARSFGATDVIEASSDEADWEALADSVRHCTGGEGADFAFEATGVAALAFIPLLLVRHGGQVLQLSGTASELAVPGTWFRWNKSYTAPLYGGCVPERDVALIFEHHGRGALELDRLVTRVYRLEKAEEAMADMCAGRVLKAVVDLRLNEKG